MLREETVEARTLALIKRLSSDQEFNNFVLVGGTALSLQLGHRKSIDIDLFNEHAFDGKRIAAHLQSSYGASRAAVDGNAVTALIQGVKTDLLRHGYKWVRPIQETDGIRMASLEDIAAMKLNAIVGNGSRLKDYVDIHFLLEKRSLDQLTAAYTEKYPDMSAGIAKSALLYHSDIDFTTDLHLLTGKFNWRTIQQRLREAVVEPKKVFKAALGQTSSKGVAEENDLGQAKRKGLRR
jgi:hypothetical protein